MLEISDLTHRIAGRLLFENASAFIAEGWKVGLVGRNGSGKSTLVRLIQEEAGRPDASIRTRRGVRRSPGLPRRHRMESAPRRSWM